MGWCLRQDRRARGGQKGGAAAGRAIQGCDTPAAMACPGAYRRRLQRGWHGEPRAGRARPQRHKRTCTCEHRACGQATLLARGNGLGSALHPQAPTGSREGCKARAGTPGTGNNQRLCPPWFCSHPQVRGGGRTPQLSTWPAPWSAACQGEKGREEPVCWGRTPHRLGEPGPGRWVLSRCLCRWAETSRGAQALARQMWPGQSETLSPQLPLPPPCTTGKGPGPAPASLPRDPRSAAGAEPASGAAAPRASPPG